jgi:Skp family chaperone for outer membrane proteins
VRVSASFALRASRLMMNLNILRSALVLLAALFVCAAFAQGQTAPARPTQTPATQTTAVAVPTSRIAVIYSGDFQDPKAGILKFNALVARLNGEFQKSQDDLNATAQRLKALQAEITTLQGIATTLPSLLQTKIEQFNQQKRDYTRRGEDTQAAYQKRREELFGPLQDDVGKALDAYAKARGITMIFDGSIMPLVYAADGLDITRAFIIDYNSKNPVTPPAATPK